jgi:hypothetical protein
MEDALQYGPSVLPEVMDEADEDDHLPIPAVQIRFDIIYLVHA